LSATNLRKIYKLVFDIHILLTKLDYIQTDETQYIISHPMAGSSS